jgi:hypothetical protein
MPESEGLVPAAPRRTLTAVNDRKQPASVVDMIGEIDEAVVAPNATGALKAWPIDGEGKLYETDAHASLLIEAAGAKVCAVAAGHVTYADDAAHGHTAILVSPGGWQYIYAGLGLPRGVERDCQPGEVLGIAGQGVLTFVAVGPAGTVDPMPLLRELHAGPEQPGSPLPNLRVIPMPGLPVPKNRTPGAQASPQPTPAPSPVPAPAPVPVQRPAADFGAMFKSIPPWMLAAGAFMLLQQSKGGGGRRRAKR